MYHISLKQKTMTKLNPKPKKEKALRTFKYTIENKDEWRITDYILVIVAQSKTHAKILLTKNGYNIQKTSEIVELKEGIHMIQEMITE